eukprot:PhM_4_TR8378/c8_g3_i2/m.65969
MGSCVSTSKQTSVVSATADPAEVSDDRDNKVKHNVDQNQEDCENRKEDEQQQQQKTSTKNMNTSAGFDSVVFGPKNPLQAPENSAEQSSNREKSTPPESSSLQEKKKQQQQQQQQRFTDDKLAKRDARDNLRRWLDGLPPEPVPADHGLHVTAGGSRETVTVATLADNVRALYRLEELNSLSESSTTGSPSLRSTCQTSMRARRTHTGSSVRLDSIRPPPLSPVFV